MSDAPHECRSTCRVLTLLTARAIATHVRRAVSTSLESLVPRALSATKPSIPLPLSATTAASKPSSPARPHATKTPLRSKDSTMRCISPRPPQAAMSRSWWGAHPPLTSGGPDLHSRRIAPTSAGSACNSCCTLRLSRRLTSSKTAPGMLARRWRRTIGGDATYVVVSR